MIIHQTNTFIPACVTRLAEFATSGYPKEYSGSDMMKNDINEVILALLKSIEIISSQLLNKESLK